MSEADKLRLGRTTRVLAWVFGVVGAVSGLVGVGAVTWALAGGRMEDFRWHALGALSSLASGFMLLHAAHAGRDTTTEYLSRLGLGPNTASQSSS